MAELRLQPPVETAPLLPSSPPTAVDQPQQHKGHDATNPKAYMMPLFLSLACLVSLTILSACFTPTGARERLRERPPDGYSSLPEAHKHQLFLDFKATFRPSYTSNEEEEKRYGIFKENLEEIDKLVVGGGETRWTITKWADQTLEEMVESSGKRGDHTDVDWSSTKLESYKGVWEGDCRTCGRFPLVDLYDYTNVPDQWDWRRMGAVTPVMVQGRCGSCFAISAVEDVESAMYVSGHRLVPLSKLQVLACDKNDEGCYGGYPMTAFDYVYHEGGLLPDKMFPYQKNLNKELRHIEQESSSSHHFPDDGPPRPHFKCNRHVVSPKNFVAKIDGWQIIADHPDRESVLLLALLRLGPLSVGLNAERLRFYDGGVDSPSQDQCDPNHLTHALTLVGYGNKGGHTYYILKNNWGTEWGENGYYYLRAGGNRCGVANQVTHAVISHSVN